jgi:DNA-binding phage protein
MAITRSFRDTVQERIERDDDFATALLDEAISLFLNGEPDLARLVLRDLVNATVGFEELASEVQTPSKSLHRMLSARGNPTMDNLTKIFSVLKEKLGVDFEVHAVKQV